MVNNPRDNFWNWIIVAVYCAVVMAIVPFHEPWRDEAHTWLLARDRTIPQIFQQLPYEGYPPLWFLMQVPLAKWGLPYASLGVLNALCATLAVAILVFFSPFALWQKALIAFSDILFCWIGMIWRCYSLMALGLFLALALYPVRHRRPVLYALSLLILANAHVMSLGVALLLFLGFTIGLMRQYFALRSKPALDPRPSTPWLVKASERRPLDSYGASLSSNIIAGVIMACGLAFLILGLRQPPDCRNPGAFPFVHRQASLDLLGGTFGHLLFPREDGPNRIPFYAIGIGAFGLFLYGLRKSREAFWLMLLTFLGWSYVFTFKTAGPSWQHFPPMTLMMIGACWLARSDHPPATGGKRRPGWKLPMREAILFASLLFGLFYVPQWIYAEIRYPFSMGKEAAEALRNVSPNQPIVACPFSYGESLLPYLPGRKFWSLEMGKFDTVHSPTAQFDSFEYKLPLKLPPFPEGLPWVVAGISIEKTPGYELVYPRLPTAWPWFVTKECFWIYRPKSTSQAGQASQSP